MGESHQIRGSTLGLTTIPARPGTTASGPGCVKTGANGAPIACAATLGEDLADQRGAISRIELCAPLMGSWGHLHGLIWACQDAPHARMAATNPPTPRICMTRFML
jgi:hypothetical protein